MLPFVFWGVLPPTVLLGVERRLQHWKEDGDGKSPMTLSLFQFDHGHIINKMLSYSIFNKRW